jgi:UDP-N-acetylmuramate: L-alanyl-gamma-D-glutamyl-meso-diaminopimelate ligase
VHFVGICGKGMGPVAAALAHRGWRITGSDEATYPPMNRFLAERGIMVRSPYSAANIPVDAELAIVGKRVRRDNPELQEVIARGLQFRSFPAFLRDAFLSGSRSAVVSGGVGKTTTTAMLAFILEHAGRNPDYLIGGLPHDFAAPARFAGSGFAVIEGDEYASCFDDPDPKFLKYAPELAVVTNLLEDHPDLYGDAGDVERAFLRLVHLIPLNGCLVLTDDVASASLAGACKGKVVCVGFSGRADCRIEHLSLTTSGSAFTLVGVDFTLPLAGRMNVCNAALAAVAAAHFDVPLEQSAAALATFGGIADRQAARIAGNCVIVVDKACHPVSVAALLGAVRQRYPERRLVSVLRPRATGGRNWIYQRDLPGALEDTDLVVLLKPYEHDPEPGRTWPGGPFSPELLASELTRRQKPVFSVQGRADLLEVLGSCLKPRDVVILTLPEQVSDLATAIANIAERL